MDRNQLARADLHSFFPNSAFSDVMLSPCNWPWKEYLQQGNQQIRLGFLPDNPFLNTSSTPLCRFMFNFVRNSQCFEVVAPFDISVSDVQEFQWLHILSNIWCYQFLILAILMSVSQF